MKKFRCTHKTRLLMLSWLFLCVTEAQAEHGNWFYRSDDGFCIIGTEVADYGNPQGNSGRVVLSLIYASKTLANPACYALPTTDQAVAFIYPLDDVVRPSQSANLISARLANVQASDTLITRSCTEETGYVLSAAETTQLLDALAQDDVIQITSHLYKAGTVRGVVSTDNFEEDYQQFLSCVDAMW